MSHLFLRSGDCSNGRLLLKSRPTHDNRGTLSTVGISFGSPTSGQGFDVSSAVRQIIANLPAVETPGNTELTTLHSEDTLLISIGTDLIRSQVRSIQSPAAQACSRKVKVRTRIPMFYR